MDLAVSVDTTPLSNQVEHALKAEIISGRLAPGQRISLEELAAKWNVSYTPVRDAIRHLESQGFLKVLPRRGVFVTALDAATFQDIFEVRIAMEVLAAKSATVRAPAAEMECILHSYREAEATYQRTNDSSLLVERDYMVHDLLMRYCSNARVVQIMHGLRDLIDWAQATIVTRNPAAYATTVHEHMRVIEAMLARDVQSAQHEIETHLQSALARYLEVSPDALVVESG